MTRRTVITLAVLFALMLAASTLLSSPPRKPVALAPVAAQNHEEAADFLHEQRVEAANTTTTTSTTVAPKPQRATRSYRRPLLQDVDGVWQCIHTHEASDWHNNDTGHNGHYGGLQFAPATWRSVGGSGNPADASPDEQMMRGRMLQARSGWGQWASHGKCGV